MILTGLADFHDPLSFDEGTALFGFGASSRSEMFVLPRGLRVADRADGTPDLRVDYVAGATGYGLLTLRVEPEYAIAPALEAARARVRDADLRPALLAGGFFRLSTDGPLPGVDPDVAAALVLPAPIAPGAAMNEVRLRLSEPAIVLVKEMLEGRRMLVSARAEVEIEGVAPRFPLALEFDPRELCDALAPAGDGERMLCRSRLVQRFRDDLDRLPLRLRGDVQRSPLPPELPETLVDHLRMTLGELRPAPEPGHGQETWFAVARPARGAVRLDLSEPRRVRRPLALSLHPLEAARRIVERDGLGAVWHAARVRTIDVGARSLDVALNLPAIPAEVARVTVDVHVPASRRRSAIDRRVELGAPELRAAIALQLAPGEELAYEFRAAIELVDGGLLAGDAWTRRAGPGAEILLISPLDLPCLFGLLRVDPALVDAAVLSVRCAFTQGAHRRIHACTSSPTRDGGAISVVALPASARDAAWTLEARQRGGEGACALGPLPFGPRQVGLASFKEYGPHRIEVVRRGRRDAPYVCVDLLPACLPEAPENITRLLLSPGEDRRTWSWVASSIFAPGYRYRVVPPGTDAGPLPWSPARAPELDLHLDDPPERS